MEPEPRRHHGAHRQRRPDRPALGCCHRPAAPHAHARRRDLGGAFSPDGGSWRPPARTAQPGSGTPPRASPAARFSATMTGSGRLRSAPSASGGDRKLGPHRPALGCGHRARPLARPSAIRAASTAWPSPRRQDRATAGGDCTADSGTPTCRSLAMELPRRGSVRFAAYSPEGEQIAGHPRGRGRFLRCPDLPAAGAGLPAWRFRLLQLAWSPDGTACRPGEGIAARLAFVRRRPSARGPALAVRESCLNGRLQPRRPDRGLRQCVDGDARFCDASSGSPAESRAPRQAGPRPGVQPRRDDRRHGQPRRHPVLGRGQRAVQVPASGTSRHGAPVAFSPDGKSLLTGCVDNPARPWNPATGKPIGPPLGHQGGVLAAAFSHDGKTLLSAGMDGQARFWDAATGMPGAASLTSSWVRSAAFSPDGRLVLTASHDGEARLWDATTGRPVGPADPSPQKRRRPVHGQERELPP